MTSLELTQKAAAILDNKKADELKVLGIRELSVLADYFVLATGTSSTHVKTLAGELEFQLKETGAVSGYVGGYRSNSWVLLDYGHIIIHILTAEACRFYNLDRLWQDAENIELSFLGKAE